MVPRGIAARDLVPCCARAVFPITPLRNCGTPYVRFRSRRTVKLSIFEILSYGENAMAFSDDLTVVGFTGAIGAGCSTATEQLESEHFEGYKLASFIDNSSADGTGVAAYSGLTVREKQQAIGSRMRATFGASVLVDRALATAEANPKVIRRIVIDGIRNTGEVAALRRRFGFRFWLVGVLSDSETRLERKLPSYLKGQLDEATFREDDQRDHDENGDFGQQVARCVNMADAIMINGSDISAREFKWKVSGRCSVFNAETPPTPTADEVHMQMAFASSHLSQCLKRHVGAIVIDAAGEQVSSGYNENPGRTKPCWREPSYGNQCHRDMVVDDKFAELFASHVHCPVCGEGIDGPKDCAKAFERVGDVVPGPRWRCMSCENAGRVTDLQPFFFPDRAMFWCTAIHAEDRALRAAGDRARGGTLYSTTLPCFQCAERLCLAGIKKVVYVEAYPDPRVAQRLKLAEIDLQQFEGVLSQAFERVFAGARPGLPGAISMR